VTISISVVIYAQNAAAHIERCIGSVRDQQPPVGEIIVVDHGSGDRAAAVARSLGASVTRPLSRAHPSRALDTAARMATGDVLAFIDSESVVMPGWAQEIGAHFESGADLVAGGLRKVPPRTLVDWFVQSRDEGHDLTGRRNGFLPFAVTPNLAIRKTVFDELEGFDPELQGQMDIDLSFRAQLRGYRLTYAPEAAVVQDQRNGLFRLMRQRLRHAREDTFLNWKYQQYPFQGSLRSWRLQEEVLELARGVVFERPLDARHFARPWLLLAMLAATAVGRSWGWLWLYSGVRRPPAVLLPKESAEAVTAAALASGPRFLILGEDRPAMRLLAGSLVLATNFSLAPPYRAEGLARRWEEPAPWSLRLSREARRQGLRLPEYLAARRLEHTRPRTWGEAFLNLQAVHAWLHGKWAYGVAASGPSGPHLARLLPGIPIIIVDGNAGRYPSSDLLLTRHDLLERPGDTVARLEQVLGQSLSPRMEQFLHLGRILPLGMPGKTK
jgi:glycosyltransferase involved in cell wall biosynthesis